MMSTESRQLAVIEAKLDQVIKFLEGLGMGSTPRRSADEIERMVSARVLKLTTKRKASKNP